MRLWSIHPQYLDAAGLVACWREALLAQKVLLNQTKGYRNHPQLIRFRNSEKTIEAINTYLFHIFQEAEKRNYHFDKSKIGNFDCTIEIPVTEGQIQYEAEHLKEKLRLRTANYPREIFNNTPILPHPLFKVFPGEKEIWEKT